MALESIFDVWATGLRVGATTLPSEPVLGLKRIILPVSYWRAAEFAYVARHLDVPHGGRVLDLGSPKDLALFFAKRRGYEVVAVDILPEAVEISERYARAQGIAGVGPGKVLSEVRDGRRLPYPDNSFDGAFSVSVLEHIPDHGDTDAIRELLRVVRPGGRVVVTTPYDYKYRETFVEGPVYDRQATGPNFFERHYDDQALAQRLLDVGDGTVTDLQIWGERGLRIERLLSKAGPLRTVLSPFEALLAGLALSEVGRDGGGHAMAAFFTLTKRSRSANEALTQPSARAPH